MSVQYFTVKDTFEYTSIIERSKFICSVKNISCEEDAKLFIAEIKKKHPFATHNCYGYIADDKGLIEKFSDDGEPQGTAGKPILEVLRNFGFRKTVAVVTRYFGGIKLGTGGLVRAYGGTLSDCLKKAVVLCMNETAFYNILTDYDGYNAILKVCSTNNSKIIESDFSLKIKIKLAIRCECEDKIKKEITDLTLGKAGFEFVDKGFYSF